MTTNEFLDELRKLVKQEGVKFTTKNAFKDVRFHKDDKCFCPITYVCYKKLNKFYDMPRVDQAGEQLGLNDYCIKKIVYAADVQTPGNVEPDFREELIQACC